MSQAKPTSFLRERWLKALRSGHYQQGREYMLTRKGDPYAKPNSKHPEGHCVLGVMCEVFFAYNRGWGWEPLGATPSDDPRLVITSNDLPPDAILEAFDVPLGFALDLAKMNDRGYSFKRLADHLEAVWAREQPRDEPALMN
jgi:hypothetical protein